MSKDRIDIYEIIPSQAWVLEEKVDLKVKTIEEEESLHQEIVCDDSSPDSATSSNENGDGEEGGECLESSCDAPCFEAEEKVDNIESQESLKSSEINKGQYENSATETEVVEDDDVGNNDDDDDDEVAFETSEDSSEETGRTWLNSNEAAIWPAELIEELQEVKGGIVNVQNESEGAAKTKVSDRCASDGGDRDSFEVSECAGKDMTPEASAYEKANFYVAMKHQQSVSRSSKSRTWIISMLTLSLLLLVLLFLRIPASLFVLDGGDSVISP